MKKSKFLEKAREKHGYRYQYPDLPEVIMQNDYINVIYNGVIYRQRVLKHFKGSRPELKTLNKTTEEFITESIAIWGDKYDYSILEYKNSRTKVKIIYDGIVYEQYPNSHLNGYPVEGYLDQNIFIQKAIKKWGNKYDYSLVKFENANKKIEILFNGDLYHQTPHNHLKYAPEKRLLKKTTSQFIQESIKIHGDFRYLYDKVIYSSDREKVIITCPIHGDFNQRPNQHIRGAGCPNCNESRGEKEIAKFLDKYDINYDRQYRFNECRGLKYPLPFDFYIPSNRTCIEFDGEQHFLPLPFFGGLEAYERLKTNDKIKNDYCEDNYINLIRIRYNQIDDIWRILYENLKNHIKTKKTS
jgi:hypothetical protein